jgi:hypothetical protein
MLGEWFQIFGVSVIINLGGYAPFHHQGWRPLIVFSLLQMLSMLMHEVGSLAGELGDMEGVLSRWYRF